MSRFALLGLTLSVGLAACSTTTSADPGPPGEARGPLRDLAWLAGTWVAEDQGQGTTTTERWSVPRGTVMLGSSETLQGEGTVHWEHLRIERRDDGRVVFVASPAGQATTEFVRVETSGQVLEVENPDHDFPTLLRYWREGELLRARVEGADGEGFDVRFTPRRG